MLDLSLESILRQDGNFFKELTSAVIRLKEGKDYSTTGIKKSLIMSVIKEYTGMKVSFRIDGEWTAHMHAPMLTTNHALFKHFIPGNLTKSNTIFDINAKEIKGTVDTAKGRVGGVFSDITVDLAMGHKWFSSDNNTAPADETAAIILHELGHAFTYFQFLSTLCIGNTIVGLAARDLLNTSSYSERQVIIKKAEEMLGTDSIFSSAEFVDNPKPGVDVLMMTRYIQDLNMLSLDSAYSFRNCEQLADTYVVKQCGAAVSARALDRLFRKYGAYGVPNFFAHVMGQAAFLFKFVLKNPAPFYYIFSAISPEIYDRPLDRIMFHKRQLVDDLKKVPKNDSVTRNAILEEIAAVEEIANSVTYRRDVIDFLRDKFTKAGRYLKNNADENKQLEAMVYNDLFIAAAKLKNMQK